MVQSVRKIDFDKEKLTLIVKSKNKVGSPVYQEDLPSVLFNKAPRTLLGSKWFDKQSKKNSKLVCESCYRESHLERHELYGLYLLEGEPIIRLEGIMQICHSCHSQIHSKVSRNIDLRYGRVNMPAPVSDAMDTIKYPWNQAKYIIVEDQVYSLK